MILKVLFIQRKCSYEGEFAPETLCCIDEYCYDNFSQGFDMDVEELLREQKNNISSHAVIDIEIDQEKIANILNNNPTIQGEINEKRL